MGKILLEGIEVMVRIGLLEEELYAPQDLLLSVEIEHDFSKIAKTDEVEDGIDYRNIVDHTRDFSQAYDGKTLEKYASLLAEDLKGNLGLNGFAYPWINLGMSKNLASTNSSRS